MKHIKKYEEKLSNYSNNLDNFYNDYKNLFENDETDYEDENNYDSKDFLTEIGQLTLDYNLSKDDVLFILNNYDCSFDVDGLLKIILSDYDNYENENSLWIDLINSIKTSNLDQDKLISSLKYKFEISRKIKLF